MKFGIIGYGRFGQLWEKKIKKFGDTDIFDINKKVYSSEAQLKKVVCADILFLLVPISDIEACCKQIKPLLEPHTIVIDACSVKEFPAKIMKKFLPNNQPIIATHPLFGPDSDKNSKIGNKKITVSPLRATFAQINIVENLLRKIGLQIIRTTPSLHDKYMANSQALVHFIGRGLTALKLGEQKIFTPDYETLLQMNSMVNNDTWDLFFDMQRKNRFSAKLRASLLNRLRALEMKIIGDKKSSLAELRGSIEQIDKNIFECLENRFRLSHKIGQFKRKNKQKIIDKKRENQLKKLYSKWGSKCKLSPSFINKLFSAIVTESKIKQ